MKQLTTTTNQFKLEETLMEKVFEASGYQFTIITPNDSEPHFVAKEVAKALGYTNDLPPKPSPVVMRELHYIGAHRFRSL